jgi:short-subunit dehydrogenase
MPTSDPRPLCLITGASAGIGTALARVYAAHGWDLALTARRTERLEALAAELSAAHGIEAFAIPADLAEPGASDLILKAVADRGRVVAGLVNNAGYGLGGSFAVTNWADQAAMLQVMLTAVCELTHKTLPGMVERRFGRIINVASVAGLMPGSPGQTLYTPIKAFLVRFSQTLHLETAAKGVHVTALCPGFTHTEFHDVNQSRARMEKITPKWLWQDADAVARSAFAAVDANHPVCITGAHNQLLTAIARLIPDSLALRLTAGAYGKRG